MKRILAWLLCLGLWVQPVLAADVDGVIQQEEETKEGMLSSRPIRRSIIQLQQQRSIRMRTFLRKSTLTVS